MATVYYDTNNATTASTWYHWNNDYRYSTSSTTNSDAWSSWTTDTTMTCPACAHSDGVWYIWSSQTATVTEQFSSAKRMTRAEAKTFRALEKEQEAQRKRWEQAELVRQEKERERIAQIQEAERVARETLKAVLTKEQLDRFERDECIPVDIEAERFVITKGISGNVKRVNETGKVVEKICCHPTLDENGHALPVYDVMLAQLLHLKCNKEAFLKTANITRQ